MPPPDGADARRITEDYAERLRRRQIGLLRYDAYERRRILTLLRQVELDIVARIEAVDPTAVTRLTYRQRRLQALLDDVRARIREHMRRLLAASGAGLTSLALDEAAWAHDALRLSAGRIGVDLTFRAAPDEVLRQLVGDALIQGATNREWWSRQGDRMIRRFTDQMRIGVAQGESVSRLVSRVRGTRAAGYADGFMATTRREVEALVRTGVNTVGNEARLATYRANADVIDALVHSSILDSRTTLVCSARDGLAWTLDGDPISHGLPFQAPPLHWQCRSSLQPRIVGAPNPDRMEFNDWLGQQSETRQNEILGPGRARLWREGRVTLQQLLDFKGDPLPLDIVRQRYG